MDAPVVLSIALGIALVVHTLLAHAARRSQQEELRMAYRDGRREGIQHYKEIWAIVASDFADHHQRCLRDDSNGTHSQHST